MNALRALGFGSVALLCGVLVVAAVTQPARAQRVDLAMAWLEGDDPTTAAAEGNPPGGPGAPATDSDRDLRVRVWQDRDEESVYQRGEEIHFQFRSNVDAYVVVYRIDADGITEVLWPNTRYNDGFVYGGHDYTLPPPGATRSLHTSLSRGVEYVEAIASRYPFDLRNLAIDFTFDPEAGQRYDHKVAGDPFLAVNDVNYAITGLKEDVSYIVTDWTHVYVDSKVDYPRYACNQCHTDDSHPVHPYVDHCTQVVVSYDWGWYNHWWGAYGYYPLFYDPPYFYWDLVGCRPYYNWYYPVWYAWPNYCVYTRPYPMWDWGGAPYYSGDYLTRYRNGGAVSPPLYAVGPPASQERFGGSGNPARGGEPPSIARGRSDFVGGGGGGRMSNPADRGLPGLDGRERSTMPQPAGRSTALVPSEGRTGVRSDFAGRERTLRSLPSPATLRIDRPDSFSPSSRSAAQERAAGRVMERGASARRWTRPVIRNTESRGAVSGPASGRIVSPPRDDPGNGGTRTGDSGRDGAGGGRSSAGRDGGRGSEARPAMPQPSRTEHVAPPSPAHNDPPARVAPQPRSAPPPAAPAPPRSAPSPRGGNTARGGGGGSHQSGGGGGGRSGGGHGGQGGRG